MIHLYDWPTPNGWQASIMLEECRLPCAVQAVHIRRGDHFKLEFLAIGSNNRVAAVADRRAPRGVISIFESGAAPVYLAE